MCHIYWLILSLSITTYLLVFLGNRWRRIRGQVAQFSPQNQQELFLVVVVRGDTLNVVLPVERCRCVASTAGRAPAGVPLPFTTLHCCCHLVSTDGMNIFLNFANSITPSLLIMSLFQTDQIRSSTKTHTNTPRRRKHGTGFSKTPQRQNHRKWLYRHTQWAIYEAQPPDGSTS